MTQPDFDLVVIGSGITGLTAARLAGQRGLRTACIESVLFGGLVININELDVPHDNGPVSGISLATGLMGELVELGVTNLNETVTSIQYRNGGFSVVSDGGSHGTQAVIVASGARLRRLGVPGEAAFEHKGVSTCADCDGPMYRGKDVAVVGGGDSALQEALVLADYGRHIHLLVRGTAFRARGHLVAAVSRRDNIHVKWNTVVEEVLGAEYVEGVRARSTSGGETFEIPCSAVFPFIGLQPNVDFVPSDIRRDANDSLATDTALQTSRPGVFAAGAVRGGYGGLLADAVSDAGTAVASASAWLAR